MTHTVIDQRHLLVRLQREWDRLARSPRAISTARSWPIVIERFDSLDDLLRHAGYGTVQRDHHGDDEVLAALLRLARDQELAARIVLQRLLPGITSISRRRSRHAQHQGTQLESVDELLASAWTVIRTFPVERRCTYLAANLLRDIEYHAFRRDARRKATFLPTPAEVFETTPAAPNSPTAAEELRDLLDDAVRAGFDRADLALITRLACGTTTTEMAAEMHVTDRTIRNHRTAALYRLRHVALCAE